MTARATATGGGGGTTTSLGVNVKDYGAQGNLSDDTAAFNAAIAAANPAYLDLYIPPGRYRLTGEISLNTGQGIQGAGAGTTSLEWSSDLGAGKYGIKINGAQAWKTRVRGIALTGPYNSGTGYVVGCNMNGIKMASGSTIENCLIQGFYAGVSLNGNHEEIRESVIQGNYYGIYFSPDPLSAGNQCIEDVLLGYNRLAAFAVAGNNGMAACHIRNIHVGSCPLGFYGETAPLNANASFVNGVTMIDCAFEGYFDGIAYAEPLNSGNSRNFAAHMIGCTEGSFFAGNGAGSPFPRRAAIDVPGGITITTDAFPGEAGPATPGAVLWSGSGVDPASVVTARYSEASGVTGHTSKIAIMGRPKGCTFKEQVKDLHIVSLQDRSDVGGNGTWTKGSVVARYTVDAAVMLGGYYPTPGGVLYQDPIAGSNTVLVAVAGPGGIPVISTDATIATADYVKLATDTGAVIRATGPTDGRVIGYAMAPQSAGFVSVCLRGLV